MPEVLEGLGSDVYQVVVLDKNGLTSGAALVSPLDAVKLFSLYYATAAEVTFRKIGANTLMSSLEGYTFAEVFEKEDESYVLFNKNTLEEELMRIQLTQVSSSKITVVDLKSAEIAYASLPQSQEEKDGIVNSVPNTEYIS